MTEAEHLQTWQQVGLEVVGLHLQTDEGGVDGGDLLQNEVLAVVSAEDSGGRVPELLLGGADMGQEVYIDGRRRKKLYSPTEGRKCRVPTLSSLGEPSLGDRES